MAAANYSGHLLENTKKRHQLNPFVPVTRSTPPTFLLHAQNDPVDDVENTKVYYAALKKAGVPVELHLFPEGGQPSAFAGPSTRSPNGPRWLSGG